MRIDQLFRFCNLSSIQDDFDSWYDSVEALWRELSGRMTDEEYCEAKKIILEARNWCKVPSRSLQERRNKRLLWEMRDKLHDAEVYLRRILRKRGMDLPDDGSHRGFNIGEGLI